jgi:crotonobetainyl-CoA:carnitine CoA-transferase CaiB-like acyl-CoA transferase
VVGVHGGFALLAALANRQVTGRGMQIDLSAIEAQACLIGDSLLACAANGTVEGRSGNDEPGFAPHDCYRCAGDDQWVVLSVGDDAEWGRLVVAMGDPPWAQEDRFARADGRRANHDELDKQLAAWTAGLSKREVFARCRAADVTAGPVLDEPDLFTDPQLAARRFFRLNGSADVPECLFPGHLWHWDGPPLAWGPINRLGADNEYVYREVLGLDDDEWAALDAEHHLSLDYVDADGNPL